MGGIGQERRKERMTEIFWEGRYTINIYIFPKDLHNNKFIFWSLNLVIKGKRRCYSIQDPGIPLRLTFSSSEIELDTTRTMKLINGFQLFPSPSTILDNNSSIIYGRFRSPAQFHFLLPILPFPPTPLRPMITLHLLRHEWITIWRST